MATPDIQALPVSYRRLLELAQERFLVEILLLDELKGGRTDALLYLVSLTPASIGGQAVRHLILKLDAIPRRGAPDEIEQHKRALSLAPPDFARQHIADLAYEVKEGEALAVFYAIAGQSLLQFRPLAAYTRQSQLETLFRATDDLLLNGWNDPPAFDRGVHPHKLLERWLSYRLKPGGRISEFLEQCCGIASDTPGFVIRGEVYPNPLAYGRDPALWGKARPMDVLTGSQHGDLNTRNILARFTADGGDLAGCYLIDFALFKSGMPLLFDQRYLEMSYLFDEIAKVGLDPWVDLMTAYARADTPDPQHVPVGLAGPCAALNAGRLHFGEWVATAHASLCDDLWGQFWLAAAAAGMNFCNKQGMANRERLAGLVFASAHLKRFCSQFGLPAPADVRPLFERERDWATADLTGLTKPVRSLGPSGTVTFLFTDIEGSAPLAQLHPTELPALLARHHAILDEAIAHHSGRVFQIVGDAFCAAFSTAGDALAAALEAQRALQHESWSPAPVVVRMGLHTGVAQAGMADERTGGYAGYVTLTRAQRVMSAAHGGQVLVSGATAELLRGQLPAGVVLRDLGRHHLKGLDSPEHLWQAIAPELRADFPPLPTVSVRDRALPEQATPFVGRRREIAEIGALLDGGRLVTLHGPGGIGKTRLALAVAEERRARTRDGAYFVSMLAHDSPSAIVPAIAQELGVTFLEGRQPQDQLLDALRPRRLLLVLDNLEHLLHEEKAAATLALVEALLGAAPGLTLLVTSRELLRLPQEQAYSVEGLPVGEVPADGGAPARGAGEGGPAQAVSGEDGAVALFRLHARRVQPANPLDSAEELKLIRELCQAVVGMPLAIELAAAQLRLLPLAEITTRIESSLDVLETGLRGSAARHGSMRGVLETSWNGLEPAERLVFPRLSVFRGGFTVDGAEQVVGAGMPELIGLVDKSLIARTGDGRFSLHPLVHRFAGHKLVELSDEPAQTQEKHFQYYRALAGAAAGEWERTRNRAALEALRPDVDNALAAWSWALEHRDWDAVSEITDALWTFHRVQGRLTEAMELVAAAIAGGGAGEPAPPDRLAHWEGLLGDGHQWLSEVDEAAVHFHSALAALGWPVPQGRTSTRLSLAGQMVLQALHRLAPALFIGRQAHRQAAIDEAVVAYQNLELRAVMYNEELLAQYYGFRTLNLAEAGGRPSWMASTYATTSYGLLLAGARGVAASYARRAESAATRECTDLARTSMGLALGWYYFCAGEHQPARAHFEAAADAAGRLEQGWNQGNALVGLLYQAYYLGEYRRCLDYASQIRESGRRRGDLGFVGAADYWNAVVKLQWGRLEEANAQLEQSAATPPSAMKPFDWTIVWGAQTRVYLRQGELELAVREADKFTRMVAEAGSIGTSMSIYPCSGTAATYLAAWEAAGGGDCTERKAAELACRQLEKEARGNPYGRSSARLYRGCYRWLAGRPREAYQAWAEALTAAVTLCFPYEEALAHYEIGRHLKDEEAGIGRLGETPKERPPNPQIPANSLGRQEHLERAAEIFERLEIPYELGLCRAALKRGGD